MNWFRKMLQYLQSHRSHIQGPHPRVPQPRIRDTNDPSFMPTFGRPVLASPPPTQGRHAMPPVQYSSQPSDQRPDKSPVVASRQDTQEDLCNLLEVQHTFEPSLAEQNRKSVSPVNQPGRSIDAASSSRDVLMACSDGYPMALDASIPQRQPPHDPPDQRDSSNGLSGEVGATHGLRCPRGLDEPGPLCAGAEDEAMSSPPHLDHEEASPDMAATQGKQEGHVVVVHQPFPMPQERLVLVDRPVPIPVQVPIVVDRPFPVHVHVPVYIPFPVPVPTPVVVHVPAPFPVQDPCLAVNQNTETLALPAPKQPLLLLPPPPTDSQDVPAESSALVRHRDPRVNPSTGLLNTMQDWPPNWREAYRAFLACQDETLQQRMWDSWDTDLRRHVNRVVRPVVRDKLKRWRAEGGGLP